MLAAALPNQSFSSPLPLAMVLLVQTRGFAPFDLAVPRWRILSPFDIHNVVQNLGIWQSRRPEFSSGRRPAREGFPID